MHPPFPTTPAQHGLATTAQLLNAGWSKSAIRHLAARAGRVVLRGVYLEHHGILSAEQRLMAASLWAGPRSVLTSAHALARQGLTLGTAPGLRFLIPGSGRGRSHDGIEVTYTTRGPTYRVLGGVRTASVERALADAARFGDVAHDRARALTIAALQDGLTSVARLTAELCAGRPNGTLPVRFGLTDFTKGAWSLPEAWLETAIRRRHPTMLFLANPWLYTFEGGLIGVPDGYLPEHGVAIQVHSRAFHSGRDSSGRDRWEETVERDAVYAVHGVGLVPVAPTTLQNRPSDFLDRLDAVLAQHHGRPLPDVVVGEAPSWSRAYRRSA